MSPSFRIVEHCNAYHACVVWTPREAECGKRSRGVRDELARGAGGGGSHVTDEFACGYGGVY